MCVCVCVCVGGGGIVCVCVCVCVKVSLYPPGRICVVAPFIAGVRGGRGVHIARVRDTRTVQSLSLKAKITARENNPAKISTTVDDQAKQMCVIV